MNPSLSLRFLGSWEAHLAENVVRLRGRKAMALLAYLAVEAEQRHSRASLLGLLWPEMGEAEARNNLRVVLARLRRVWKGSGVEYVESDRHTIWFSQTAVSHLDVTQFQTLIAQSEQHQHERRADCADCMEKLATAVALYRSDFLAGFYLEDCPAFDEWLFVQREGLHVQMLAILAELAHFYEKVADYTLATTYTRRQLELDTLREGAHRQLMRLLTFQNQRTAALAQFQTCQRILNEELGVDPDADTLRLYQQIKDNNLTPPPVSEAAPLPLIPLPSPSRHNLPENITPFVGRELELQQLGERLAQPTYRLISIVGPGGMGKTRLALQAARQNQHHFPDGAFFVPLAAVPTVDEVVTAVADILDINLGQTADPTQILLEALRGQKLLLLLDNLEHLMDIVPLLLDILAQAPQVTLLVTSRERLNVQAEDLFRLRGLPIPTKAEMSEAGRFAAVRLFYDRAYRLNKDFKLDKDTVAQVVRICQAVEGMPLALELAASWLRDFPVRDLAEAVTDSVDMLASDWRDLAPQHRSVRAVFDYSWQLLTLAERALLPQLSVFCGSFSLAAARQVAGANPITLTGLRYKSLLYGAGNGRYASHELLRQLAAEKLVLDGVMATAVRQKHSTYYLNFVAQLASALQGAEPQAAQHKIRRDVDNVRTAWQWAIVNGEVAAWSAAVPGLARFYFLSGLYKEGEQVFRQALAGLADAAPQHKLPRLQLLLELAETTVRQGKLPPALAFAEEAVALAAVLEDNSRQARGHLLWGYAHAQIGEPEQARQQLQKGLSLAQEAGERPLMGELLRYLGNVAVDVNDYEEASDYLQRALAIQREVGNRAEEQAVLLYLGVMLLEQGRYDVGRDYLQAALVLIQQVGSLALEARIQNATGYALAALGELETAVAYHDRSRQIAHDIGEPFQESHALHNLCTVQRKLGNLDSAEQYGWEALRLAQVNQHSDPEAYAWLHLGYVFLAQARLADAVAAFEQSHQGWLVQARFSLAVEALAGMAVAHQRLGDSTTAFTQVNGVLAYLDENNLDGADEIFQAYLHCYEVLQAHDDPRTIPLLQRTYDELMAKAGLIGDENSRRSFLAIAAHREVTAVTPHSLKRPN